MRHTAKYWFAGLLAGLAGCVSNPPTNVHQPMTAQPVTRNVAIPANGAIFQAGINERPLFEDQRARNVGDILTINIVEKTTGNRKSNSSSTYANSTDVNTPGVSVGAAAKVLLKAFSLTGSNDNSSNTTGAGAASADMTGTITVTVIDVLANRNLLVSGEKRVALNQSDEFIRFSGVVNPTTITGTNTVQSTQVADARIEYKSAGAMNEVMNDAQSLGLLGRFFLSVLPF
ncbi:MAG TPA: flagellar basal body L-ring protein FlgH [Gallionella sp.]|jgi:flagellar L-ring protein precursor FlgH|nr:flagellar basal body L-ring protein FlgH [Gallionella sp.]